MPASGLPSPDYAVTVVGLFLYVVVVASVLVLLDIE